MTSDRWRQIEDLFNQAEAMPLCERGAFLDQACAGDSELRGEVEGLLSAASEDPGRVEQCVGTAAGAMLARDLPKRDQRIGPWQILRPIGEGGMGVVYLARRADGAYEQQAAIKVVGSVFASSRDLARFRSERQILAKLVHPNIARLLDGGVTETGQPYFVMEYVDGVPLDTWRTQSGTALSARLELFRAVCAGVQFAHRNLIVHRDIKPANILVCADGTPKLLDFGIAKMLEADSDPAEPPRTRLTERLMTPEYSSPEQILGEPTTTATDIYALGVLLYELLTGRRPFSPRTRTPAELERLICHADPPRPSTLPGHAALRGDLDNIVLKAMHKDPSRRYVSAAELSEDVRRHLEGFPVIARRDSFGYFAGKFIRRHKVVVTLAAASSVLLTSLAIGMAVLARRAEAQRDRAEQVSSFLVNLFYAADPDRPRPDNPTARDMLERGVRNVDALSSQPEVQTSLLDTFGLVYENLGQWQRSRELLRRSLSIKRQLFPAGSLEIASSLKNLAELARRQQDYPEAEAMARESIAIRTRHLGEADVLVAESKNTLALVLHESGRWEDAKRLFLDVLANRTALRRREHLETAVLSNIGALYGDLGDFANAEKYLRECISIRRKELGGNHPRLALAIGKLGQVLELSGNLERAEAAFRESLAIRRKVFGDQHPDVARSLVNLAGVERRRGRLDKAESTLARAAAIYASVPANSADRSAFLLQQGLLQDARGDLDGAERRFRESLEVRRTTSPNKDLGLARTRAALASVLARSGRREEAEALLNDALPVLAAKLPSVNPERQQAAALVTKLARLTN